ncbi:chromobox protein homolog 3-like [Adelges cooleyi]|uniref:chromobox protein homolog 3-like n=1 Tax=Adelges cooleyi TaxID=133065 RepID=UPI00217F27D5|nr:chromobox protein homolog 3-like [Adelges cooleyi]
MPRVRHKHHRPDRISQKTDKSAHRILHSEKSQEVFTIEKILNKCVVYGRIHYYLKWKGYDSIDNSWEAKEHLDCTDMIEEFEANLAKKKQTMAVEESQQQLENTKDNTNGAFDNGLEPEQILGATDSNGKLMFLLKWKDVEEATLIDSKVANIKCPQLVIDFYEKRISWIK